MSKVIQIPDDAFDWYPFRYNSYGDRIEAAEEKAIGELFKKLGGPNGMTPYHIGYGRAGKYVYEISANGGPKAVDFPMYGVTVLTETGERTKLGSVFASKDAALAYATRLGTHSPTK